MFGVDNPEASCPLSRAHSLSKIKKAMLEKHLKLIEQAARKKVQILCLQELFYGPYFCAPNKMKMVRVDRTRARWSDYQVDAKSRFQTSHGDRCSGLRRRNARPLLQYRCCDRCRRTIFGKYRKHHIPHCHPGFWEKFYFTPGNLGYPTFQTKFARIGVYICYDRHFPEGARILGLNGAEIVFNPSATVAGLSEYLWELEQPAHAVANGYFVGAINRVGTEKPWSIGQFYGKSYFCTPRGKLIAQASRDKDEVVVADLDLDMIEEVRKVWQFFRDRRPETYGSLTSQAGSSAAAD